MKIAPAKIPQRRQPNGFWFKVLTEFLEGEADCIAITPDAFEYKSLKSLQCSCASAITRYKMAISTRRKDGKLYLIKKIRKDAI